MGTRLPSALVAWLSVLGLSQAMRLTPRLTIGDTFTLYAWGHNISALPVFYADGAAVLADYTTANTTDNLLPVLFTIVTGKTSFESFIASPNTSAPVTNKATRNPPFTSATWYVSGRGSGDHKVGFATEEELQNATNIRTDGFLMSGFREIIIRSDGQGGNFMVSPVYCAFPTAIPGIWSLSWNETDPERLKIGVPVELQNVTGIRGSAALAPNAKCQSMW